MLKNINSSQKKKYILKNSQLKKMRKGLLKRAEEVEYTQEFMRSYHMVEASPAPVVAETSRDLYGAASELSQLDDVNSAKHDLDEIENKSEVAQPTKSLFQKIYIPKTKSFEDQRMYDINARISQRYDSQIDGYHVISEKS